MFWLAGGLQEVLESLCANRVPNNGKFTWLWRFGSGAEGSAVTGFMGLCMGKTGRQSKKQLNQQGCIKATRNGGEHFEPFTKVPALR